jgi:5-methylcytosine-specific restriction endonuclease McrA
MADGHLNLCKPCEYERVAAWRANNPDKVKAHNDRQKTRDVVLPEGVTQVCNACGIDKLLREFYRSRGSKLGVRGTCKRCDIAAKLADPSFVARNVAWMKANPEQASALRKRSYRKHKAKRLQARKEWRARNLAMDRAREKRYLQENRPIVYAKNARRRAAETRAVPAWLTAIHKAQIQEFYEIAVARTTQTGIKHHVDHIVPLRGEGVNGLHVPWNLQVLTEFENCSKHNKFVEARS